MIAPTKGIAPDRALLAVGAQVIMQLRTPLTVSQAWARLRTWRVEHGHPSPISFEWFVLALDMLYALGVIEFERELLVVRRRDVAQAQR